MMDALIFSTLNILPEIVVESFQSTHEFLFGLRVFHQVWEFLIELVKAAYKLIYQFLFLAWSFEELDEGSLTLVEI